MHDEKITDYHPSLVLSDDIYQLCQPLFQLLKINYFAFHRVYKEGKIIRLSTFPEWTKHYINQDYFSQNRFDQYSASIEDYEYYFWDQAFHYEPQCLHIILDSYNNFHLGNGFMIVKHHQIYTDYYIMATYRQKGYFDESIYLRMINPIEKFLDEFLNKAQSLIQKAKKISFKQQY